MQFSDVLEVCFLWCFCRSCEAFNIKSYCPQQKILHVNWGGIFWYSHLSMLFLRVKKAKIWGLTCKALQKKNIKPDGTEAGGVSCTKHMQASNVVWNKSVETNLNHWWWRWQRWRNQLFYIMETFSQTITGAWRRNKWSFLKVSKGTENPFQTAELENDIQLKQNIPMIKNITKK